MTSLDSSNPRRVRCYLFSYTLYCKIVAEELMVACQPAFKIYHRSFYWDLEILCKNKELQAVQRDAICFFLRAHKLDTYKQRCVSTYNTLPQIIQNPLIDLASSLIYCKMPAFKQRKYKRE